MAHTLLNSVRPLPPPLLHPVPQIPRRILDPLPRPVGGLVEPLVLRRLDALVAACEPLSTRRVRR